MRGRFVTFCFVCVRTGDRQIRGVRPPLSVICSPTISYLVVFHTIPDSLLSFPTGRSLTTPYPYIKVDPPISSNETPSLTSKLLTSHLRFRFSRRTYSGLHPFTDPGPLGRPPVTPEPFVRPRSSQCTPTPVPTPGLGPPLKGRLCLTTSPNRKPQCTQPQTQGQDRHVVICWTGETRSRKNGHSVFIMVMDRVPTPLLYSTTQSLGRVSTRTPFTSTSSRRPEVVTCLARKPHQNPTVPGWKTETSEDPPSVP